MNRTKRTNLMPALLLIGVLLLAITFFTAPAAHAADTDYNTYDLQKVQTFLRQADEDGKTNAEKLEWDAEDPASWPAGSSSSRGVQWTTVGGELRLKAIYIVDSYHLNPELHGTLDVSGCTALTTLDCDYNQLTALDVSGCTALFGLYCSGNQLTTLDVSDCTALGSLWCDNNQLTALDVSNNTALSTLSCSYNQLTALDVSGCTALHSLDCDNNQLTTLDVSNNTNLSTVDAQRNPLNAVSLTALKAAGIGLLSYTEDGYNWCVCTNGAKTVTVKSVGNGYAVASIYSSGSTVYLCAYPDAGCSFVEWQDAVGLSTSEPYYSYYLADSTADTMSITAVFNSDEEDDSSSIDCPTAGASFTDVASTDWFYGAVGFVADYGLFAGVGDNQFAPQANMSRAMFVQVLYNLAQKMGMQSASQSYSYTFKDVESGAWYTNAVAWAAGTGLVSGYDADTFGTNDNITREQMAAMMIKFADYAGLTLNTDGNTSFNDSAKISSWAAGAVNRTTAAGIMNGSYGAFNPLGNATRAEVAAVFKNMVEQYI